MKNLVLIAAIVLLFTTLPTEAPAGSDGCLCWQFEETVRLVPSETRLDMFCLDLWLGAAGANAGGYAKMDGGFKFPLHGTVAFNGEMVAMTLNLARYSIGVELNSSGTGQAVFYDPSKCWKTVDDSPGGGGEVEWKCGDSIAWTNVNLMGNCP